MCVTAAQSQSKVANSDLTVTNATTSVSVKNATERTSNICINLLRLKCLLNRDHLLTTMNLLKKHICFVINAKIVF
jgi:hypothetical protein